MKNNQALDQSTMDELAALESDPKVGPLAKAFGAVTGLLNKLLAKSDKADDDDDEEEDEDEDGKEGESDDQGAQPMGKSYFSAFDDGQVIDVNLEEFNAELAKSLDTRFRKIEKSLKTHIDAQVGGKLTEMQKSITESAQPTQDLLKTLEQFGMRPQRTASPTGNYQPAESGVPVRGRAETRFLLEKAYAQGLVNQLAMPMFETSGQLPPDFEVIAKSLA